MCAAACEASPAEHSSVGSATMGHVLRERHVSSRRAFTSETRFPWPCIFGTRPQARAEGAKHPMWLDLPKTPSVTGARPLGQTGPHCATC
ncbi:hypothetical protein PsYK624_168570 [Phanerochaete sordida]|uniref:Uncharacterized protein n=1 Tax=Phanerochaete sordida TaxID=48140 RepID=A0A9P3GRL5_9APHY|nr:hypothetical protein PsYK624_168570 [Phanerochaete sordida]